MRRKWCRRRLDMLSIKPRQRTGEKGAKRTGVCFLFAYLKKEVVCCYSPMQKFELKYP